MMTNVQKWQQNGIASNLLQSVLIIKGAGCINSGVHVYSGKRGKRYNKLLNWLQVDNLFFTN
jgi:hypothetical protein